MSRIGKGDIILHQQIVGGMDDNTTLIGFTNAIFRYRGPRDVSADVEMNGIPSQITLLAKIANVNPRHCLYNVWREIDPEVTPM